MTYTKSSTEILSSIRTLELLSDQTIIFHDDRLNVHRVVLASSSTYFRDLWTVGWKDQEDTTLCFNHLPVSSYAFISFFNFFYGLPIALDKDNFYDMFYLSRYFKVVDLQSLCGTLLTQKQSSEPDFLSPSVKSATEHSDCHFLSLLDFSKVLLQSNNDPVVATSTVFQYFLNNLVTPKLLEWYLQSVQLSCLDQNWTSEELHHCLGFPADLLESVSVYQLLIHPLGHVLDYYKPLVDLSVVCLRFSRVLFLKSGVDGLYDVITEVFDQLCEPLTEIPLIHLNQFCRLIPNDQKSKTIQLLLRCLVKSWMEVRDEALVETFIHSFNKLDLTLVPANWIYLNIYSKLQTDTLLQPFLNKFCIEHITPRLSQNHFAICAESAKELSGHSNCSYITEIEHLSVITERHLELFLRVGHRGVDPHPELVALFSALHDDNHPALTGSNVVCSI
ncbi:hypothetical protein GEMRC1_002040 [Eukaryota sp. GEM-RC1]